MRKDVCGRRRRRKRRLWLGNVYVLVRELHNRGRSDKSGRKETKEKGGKWKREKKKERKKESA